MPISIKRQSKQLEIKAIPGPDWEKDIATIKEIPGRRYDRLQHVWHVPEHHAEEVLARWDTHKVIKDRSVEEYLEQIRVLKSPWNILPPIRATLPISSSLKDYQERYVRIHPAKLRLLCTMEQGLGKTRASLERVNALRYLFPYPHIRLVIVCPKTVLTDWEAEIQHTLRHLTKDSGEVPVLILQGTKPKREKQKQSIRATWESGVPICAVITTYEIVGELNNLLSCDALSKPITDVILDEAHLFCNSESVRFREISFLRDLLPEQASLQALSGTPFQHKVRDIWGVAHIVCPELFGSLHNFKERYEEVVKTIQKRVPKKRQGVVQYDADGKVIYEWRDIPVVVKPKNLPELRDRLDAIMFRVSRENITEFENDVQIVSLPLSDEQRGLYERIKHDIVLDLDERRINLREAMVRSQKLLQVCEGLYTIMPSVRTSAKLEYVREQLKNASGKILVWFSFVKGTEILGEEFRNQAVIYNGSRSDGYKKWAKWSFNGLSSPDEREEYDRLNKRYAPGEPCNYPPGWAPFFIATIDMRSALGMNLHRHCSKQIFVSWHWMGHANAQAAGRLQRLGQEADQVQTIYLVSDDTFEEEALIKVLRNTKLLRALLDGTGAGEIRLIEQIIETLKTPRKVQEGKNKEKPISLVESLQNR